MTRKSWTTDAQLAWLQERKPSFREALERKTLKEFFSNILKAFRQKWPVDPATTEEIANATSPEQANKVKQEKYDRVE